MEYWYNETKNITILEDYPALREYLERMRIGALVVLDDTIQHERPHILGIS